MYFFTPFVVPFCPLPHGDSRAENIQPNDAVVLLFSEEERFESVLLHTVNKGTARRTHLLHHRCVHTIEVQHADMGHHFGLMPTNGGASDS